MRVLVACEFSGIVREAFLAAGHDAYSCDLRPALWYIPKDLRRHLQCDVRPLLRQPWDMVIAHPPCTYLTESGMPFMNRPGRREAMLRACEFFQECLNANAPRVCVENPKPNPEVRSIVGDWTQIIHPWQFGHGEVKRTCLWLHGLPPLIPTNVVSGRVQANRWISPGPRRSMLRSLTYRGVARAMALQWGSTH